MCEQRTGAYISPQVPPPANIQEIPHHSIALKNRHGRFEESKLFEQLFSRSVRQCMEAGLAQGQHGFLGDQYVSFSG
jgi:hypothetical protein